MSEEKEELSQEEAKQITENLMQNREIEVIEDSILALSEKYGVSLVKQEMLRKIDDMFRNVDDPTFNILKERSKQLLRGTRNDAKTLVDNFTLLLLELVMVSSLDTKGSRPSPNLYG